MNDELIHYGVKGMRWGIRREKKTYHKDSSKNFSRKEKSTDLSDQELNRRINRLLREQQYNTLSARKSTSIGRKIVNTIVIAAATETLKNYLSKNLKKGLEILEKNVVSNLDRLNNIDFTYKD